MKHLEDTHQKMLFNWAQYVPGLSSMFHIPNGGQRNAREAARLKAQGVKAGVLDVFLPVARGGYFGLWIEMKAPPENGKKPYPTKEQSEWILILRRNGYRVEVCWGFEEAKAVIEEYMGLSETITKQGVCNA